MSKNIFGFMFIVALSLMGNVRQASAYSASSIPCTDQEMRLADSYRGQVSRLVDLGFMTQYDLLTADLTVLEVKKCRNYISSSDFCSQALNKINYSMSRLSDGDLNMLPLNLVKDMLAKTVAIRKECN